MKILITGIAGFVGKHLASFLLNKGENNIAGIDLDFKNFNSGSGLSGEIELIKIDLTDSDRVFDVIKKFKPDQIYHLAAQSSVGYSWENPLETFRINVFGGINILEGIRMYNPGCRLIAACTAEEYGETEDEDKAIDENFSIYPENPYAVSKSSLDFLCSIYYKAYGLDVFTARSFNLTGPGQSEGFVASDFAKQVALIEEGMQEPLIEVGNLEAYRDFLDVRDAVRAYYYILDRGKGNRIYNICSGEKRKISELLDMLLSMSKKDGIEVKIDRSKFRALDVRIMYGSNRKLREHTEWSPDYSIEDSLGDILDYWRQKIIQAKNE
ncbi:MAG: GDP-mannose 4,6-dehydratase [Actinomycetota bacterium]|nr:GDP-mannose 4,6-dehydratase [Actinomycetota bacterium]